MRCARRKTRLLTGYSSIRFNAVITLKRERNSSGLIITSSASNSSSNNESGFSKNSRSNPSDLSLVGQPEASTGISCSQDCRSSDETGARPSSRGRSMERTNRLDREAGVELEPERRDRAEPESPAKTTANAARGMNAACTQAH